MNYSIIEAEKFISLWKTEIHNGNSNILYIDIPFCQKICKFCIFNSNIYTDKDFSSYIQYLIELIKKYSIIFENHPPDEVYFGGGTATLLSTDEIDILISHIPHFDKIKVKAFEGHPNSLNEKKLSFLLSKGFNYFSLGIQTFDEPTLKAVNRDYVSPQKLANIVKTIQNNEGVVSIDLIAFLRKKGAEEIPITQKDLYLLTNIVKPDCILTHSNNLYFETENDFFSLNNLIKNTLITTEYYSNYPNLFDIQDWEMYKGFNYNIYQGDFNKICKMKTFNCSGPGFFPTDQNVLGIGGFGNRMPWSYIGNKFQWYLYNHHQKDYIIEVPYNTFGENVDLCDLIKMKCENQDM